VSSGDAAAISFLRQFRVLMGAARLYQRNHPRLMEILASAGTSFVWCSRCILRWYSRWRAQWNLLPRYDAQAGELLNDPRGELRALADELLRSGICSLLFTPQINVGNSICSRMR